MELKEFPFYNINTIMGLTLSQIAWMKRYFIEHLIEIPNYKVEEDDYN